MIPILSSFLPSFLPSPLNSLSKTMFAPKFLFAIALAGFAAAQVPPEAAECVTTCTAAAAPAVGCEPLAHFRDHSRIYPDLVVSQI